MKTLLELHEGRKKKLYRCSANKWSIGVGHNIEDRGLPDEVIDLLFQIDLRVAVEDALALVPNLLDLDDARAAVVIDMSFNLGKDRLAGFRNFLRAVRAREYQRAAAEMVDSKWYHQVGDRGPRLEQMMRTGEWPDE